jgi:tetratricopeptide (TPR) repeat protein
MGPNDRLQTVCDALRRFLDLSGRWDEWLALRQDAERTAVQAGDFLNAGWRAYQAGWFHYLRRQAKEVFDCSDRAAAHWDKALAGAREQAHVLLLRGHGHRLKECYSDAINAFEESLELLRSLGRESEDVVSALNWLAVAEHGSGRLDDAKRDWDEALSIAVNKDYREGRAFTTGNLASLALDLKDWSRAETLAKEAVNLSEEWGRPALLALCCLSLATALVRQGKKAEALPHAQRARGLFDKLGLQDRLSQARGILTECDR